MLIEKSNPGGQASSSARIENYLGFPTGLSGAELKPKPVQDRYSKTFEEYLSEAFQGEVVQNGAWFSSQISDLTKRNLKRI